MVSAIATVAGAVIGSKASKSASKAAAKGQDKALGATAASTAQGRQDVIGGFAGADEARRGGFSDALSFLGGAPSQQIAPFQQGNVAAQQQISRGLPQIQNAILGLPTDLSGFQPQQIGQPADFNFDLSGFQRPAQPQLTQQEQLQQFISSQLSGNGHPLSGLFNGFNIGGR